MKAIISAVWPYAAFFCFGAATGWFITHNHAQAETERLKSTYADERRALSESAAKEMTLATQRVNDLQSRLADLDSQSIQDLQNAQKDNAALRNDVAAGKRRVLIAQSKLADCQRPAGNAASTGSMGNAASLGLTAEAGSTVYDIRTGITEDQAKIRYLQDYIRKLQSGGYIADGNKKAP